MCVTAVQMRFNMKKIKAVFMDKDGSTIIAPNILPENLANLMRERSDIHWIMATGRSYCNVLKSPMVDILPKHSLHIVEGGARVMDLANNCVTCNPLTNSELEHFFEIVPLEHLHYLFYAVDDVGGYVYSTEIDAWQDKLAILRATDDLDKFRGWFKEVHPAKLSVRVKRDIELPGLNWTQNDTYIDVTTKGVHKGSAVADMLKVLNIEPSEAIFVFNDFNDLPVINHPLLQDMLMLKVGDLMPELDVDYTVATPYDVASALRGLI